jgi:hypothetical protein
MAQLRLQQALDEFRKRLPITDESGLKIVSVSLSPDETLVIFRFNNDKFESVPGEIFTSSVLSEPTTSG